MVQAFKRSPIESIAKGLLYFTLPTLALWWVNKDEDWYKNMPDFEKYGYWHIPIGGTIIRVPRPFEWGVLFASIPEAMFQAAYEKDPKRIMEMAGQAMQIMMPPVIPSSIAVPTETIFNWDTFRRRPIVSRGMEYLKPEDRFYTSTTESAKELGKLMRVSPAKIEFLMSSFTGSLSTETLRAAEGLTQKMGAEGKGTRPRELSDLPVIGRLFLRPGLSRTMDIFYSKTEELNQAYSSSKLHKTPFPRKDASQRRFNNRTVERLQELRKRSRKIIEDTKISDDEKRIQLQALQERMEQTATRALERGK